ncbi:hypothetical protein DEO72_LG1g3090 [Vigna unguiculata]|uniref:Uncharacterized protein n=1 Tax=Vigna unguiculata TaxID=3917 RepID=A0A4D6KVX5_VIGUN|nr:hypothetical protein DEO72_LG1g3090 [Vigna unguiculata]
MREDGAAVSASCMAAHAGGCGNVGADAAKDARLFRLTQMVWQWKLRQHDDLEKMMCDGNGRVQQWTAMSMAGLASSMAVCGVQTIVDEGVGKEVDDGVVKADVEAAAATLRWWEKRKIRVRVLVV